jgi:Ca2+-binding EF-hand superfamily protein
MSVQNILNNPKRIDKIAKKVFNSVDKDGSGLIDMNELEKVMVTISSDLDLPIPSHNEVKEVFNMLDADNSTMISYKEFRVLIVGILESFA